MNKWHQDRSTSPRGSGCHGVFPQPPRDGVNIFGLVWTLLTLNRRPNNGIIYNIDPISGPGQLRETSPGPMAISRWRLVLSKSAAACPVVHFGPRQTEPGAHTQCSPSESGADKPRHGDDGSSATPATSVTIVATMICIKCWGCPDSKVIADGSRPDHLPVA